MDDLFLVSVYCNPCRYKSRLYLFKKWQDYVSRSHNVIPYYVELAYGERDFEVTEAGHPQHIQLRTRHELWHKENLCRIGASRLPHDAKYVAMVDADLKFSRDNWAEETVHQLQHFDVVQMWSHGFQLGPEEQMMQPYTSFMYCWVNQFQPHWEHRAWKHRHRRHRHHHPPVPPPAPDPYPNPYAKGPKGEVYWHPGYAWAWRREALNAVGGEIDWDVMGSSDYHMATSLIGCVDVSLPKDIHPEYRKMCHQWQHRALKHINRNIGFVPQTLMHYWHGQKKRRNYIGRWDVLTKTGYNPNTDICRDWQGVTQLTGENWKLRDAMRRYFRARHEDGIDL